MEVFIAKINDVKMNPNNPRLIKDERFKKLVKSIQDFPEMLNIRPIVVNDDMVVLGGNMRLKACKEAGLREIPVIKAINLDENKQKQFIIKDNIGFGEWDWEMLANEWNSEELSEWGLNVADMKDVDIDSFFAEKDHEELNKGKIVLNYTLDEVDIVKTELLKHGKTPEDAVYKLLGL